MRVVVTGATGLVGKRLVERLRRDLAAREGGAVVVLSRDGARAKRSLEGASAGPPTGAARAPLEAFSWNPEVSPPPADALRGAHAVHHLAGESVAPESLLSFGWSEEKKRAIRASRVEGTRRLVEGIAALPAPERPRVLVCASAVGYYGSRGDEVLSEGATPGEGFLAEVCRAWEAEAQRAEALGVRTALLRIGLVLAREGGALERMGPPFRLCLGGRLGDGRHYMPWVHVDDVVGMALFAQATEGARGPLNVCAPEPVPNREFTRAFAASLGRPAIFPAPRFALRLLLGEFADALLASQRCVPKKALALGYAFAVPSLAEALRREA